MYDLHAYGRMIADSPRISAYAEALRRSVNSESVVLDVGAGTGIMTLLACRFGARRVYAVEPDAMIQVAREIVRENGFADRVEFFQKLSTEIELPERATVMVSDLRGVLPFFTHHLPSIRDARARHLAPGAIQIPQHDTLWAAPVEAPDLYLHHVGGEGPDGFQFRFTPARRRLVNSWWRARVTPAHLLAEPQLCGSVDYRTVESPDFAAEVRFRFARSGSLHGITVWFDTELVDGVPFSNAPSSPELIYGNALFPLEEPVPVAAGDEVGLTLRADLVQSDYIWRWETCGKDFQFTQSNFFASALPPEQLAKQAAAYVPALNPDGEVDVLVLQGIAAGTPLGQIAEQLVARFPKRFPDARRALSHVGELSLRYSR